MDGVNNFDLLTLCEVAELLHVSKAHISNIVAGRVAGCAPIPTISLGRRKLVRRTSLLAWVTSNEHAAADENIRPSAHDNLQASPVRGVRKRA
jgi:hypothetical protein